MKSKSLGAKSRRTTSNCGFSLLELLIVIAIVAILAAISYPGYREYVLRAQRTEARAALMELAQFMERFHAVNYRYDQRIPAMASSAVAIEIPPQLRRSPAQGLPHHTIGIFSVSADSYVLHATPLAAHDSCGVLTLDQAGTRGASAGASVHKCWR